MGIAAVLVSCGTPADAWLGEWEVSITETNFLCDDPGAGPMMRSDVSTWRIAKDSIGYHIAGRCRIPLAGVTEDRARFSPSTCDTVLPSGQHVVVETFGGLLARTTDRFEGDQQARVTFDDGSCLNLDSEFVGFR